MTPLFPKEPRIESGGRAPLFERLCGESAWLNEGQMRLSIEREIERILNIRAAKQGFYNTIGVLGESWSEILTCDPLAEKHRIEREVEKRIELLEPRLDDVNVLLEDNDDNDFMLHIEGTFQISKHHPPVVFVTSVAWD